MGIKERLISKNINEMSDEEIAAFVRARKENQAKDNWEKAVKAKAELETYCKEKYGLSLAEIFTVSDKMPQKRLYQHPDNGWTYSYSGRGKVPAWLKGPDGKPRSEWEVKTA
jgi:hypothetical protein